MCVRLAGSFSPLTTPLSAIFAMTFFVSACGESDAGHGHQSTVPQGQNTTTGQDTAGDVTTPSDRDVQGTVEDAQGTTEPVGDTAAARAADAGPAEEADTATSLDMDAGAAPGVEDGVMGSADAGDVSSIGPALSCLEDEGVVVPTPDTYGDYKSWGFDRYAEWVAPNGKPIRIFATAQVTDEMVHRARNVLRFFLTDVPGSQYGADKAEVANSMANHGATLMLPGGAHEEGNEPPFDAQPLYEEEMTVEGGDWYLTNDWEHRDATFEEIFHLVHDAGIGTYLPGALPDYQDALHNEALAAIEDGRWGIPVDPFVSEWLQELTQEYSLAQEYIASVIDSYYGYWGAFDEAPGGMWGIYIAKTREEVAEKDPAGLALVQAFLPPMAHYEARLSSAFSGTFEMRFDASQPYTHKSRYLVAVTLTGTEPASISGNDADNVLRGNHADNILDGGEGDDTVIYCQERSVYTVSQDEDDLIIEGPDGRDTLRDVEHLHFADGLYPVGSLVP